MYQKEQLLVWLRLPNERRQSSSEIKTQVTNIQMFFKQFRSQQRALPLQRSNMPSSTADQKYLLKSSEKSKARGKDVLLYIAGICGRKDNHAILKGRHSILLPHEVFLQTKLSNFCKQNLKQIFDHLSVLPYRNFNLMEVGKILDQYTNQLQRPLIWSNGLWIKFS